MGTEFRIRREHGFSPEDISPLLASEHYRGLNEEYQQYALGVAGDNRGREIPEFSLWFENGDLGITAYETSGEAWKQLGEWLMRLKDADPTLRITSWDDDDDQENYFR